MSDKNPGPAMSRHKIWQEICPPPFLRVKLTHHLTHSQLELGCHNLILEFRLCYYPDYSNSTSNFVIKVMTISSALGPTLN